MAAFLPGVQLSYASCCWPRRQREVVRLRLISGSTLLELPLGPATRGRELREKAAQALGVPDVFVFLVAEGAGVPADLEDSAIVRNEVELFSVGEDVFAEVSVAVSEGPVLQRFLEKACAAGVEELAEREVVDVSGADLGGLPFAIEALDRVRELHAGECQIRQLPDEVGSLLGLEVLRLSANALTSLPRAFSGLRSLQRLFLEGNAITELPGDFADLRGLKVLHLENNKLSCLPATFGNLESLQLLYLQGNALTDLPTNFGELCNLKVLRLERNKLTALPDSLCKLQNLQRLFLEDNALSELPGDVGDLRDLEILRLGRNNLSVLPETVCKLRSLQELCLEGNGMTSLPDGFGDLGKLKVLDLRGNAFSALPRSSFQLTELGAVYLEVKGCGDDRRFLPAPLFEHEEQMKDDGLARSPRAVSIHETRSKGLRVDRGVWDLLPPNLRGAQPQEAPRQSQGHGQVRAGGEAS